MKVTKTEGIFLAAAALFVVFAAGYFLGRGSIDASFTVETQRMPDTEAKAAAAVSPVAETAAETQEAAPERSEQPAEGKININTADAALLDTLPGIGEKRAQDIIAYREKNGFFQYPEQIVEVPASGKAS
jgi:competence ComEA-like helix-hairpin-helix protein